MTAEVIKRVNHLRAERAHLVAQAQKGNGTSRATAEEAAYALRDVKDALELAEAEARELPEAAYLFRGAPKKSRPRGVRALSDTTTSVEAPTTESNTSKEEGMARKSKQALLEEVLVELRKAEKLLGTARWAHSGAGAAKNPPSAEKKANLAERIETLGAKVLELRTKRDELKA